MAVFSIANLEEFGLDFIVPPRHTIYIRTKYSTSQVKESTMGKLLAASFLYVYFGTRRLFGQLIAQIFCA